MDAVLDGRLDLSIAHGARAAARRSVLLRYTAVYGMGGDRRGIRCTVFRLSDFYSCISDTLPLSVTDTVERKPENIRFPEPLESV